MQRFAQLFSRRRRYDDLAVSIQEHVAERAEELMESGMLRAEAEQAARREFGNVGLIEQRSVAMDDGGKHSCRCAICSAPTDQIAWLHRDRGNNACAGYRCERDDVQPGECVSAAASSGA